MTLFLHVLMLFLLSGGSAKVVQNFEQECGEFFAGRKSPTKLPGSQYEQICQTRNDVVYFATYYDTISKIPVYSAYEFKGRKSCERPNNWLIEPQLDDNNALPNMDFEKNVNIQGLGKRQALTGDYDYSGYHRGHLVPVYHRQSQECVDATFTLTNAAPQNPSFNSGQWRELEKYIEQCLSEECLQKYSVYIVTGVVPGTKNVNNRVKVPSYFWTAYCCLDQNNKCQISKGFIGENTPENTTLWQMSVTVLNQELAKLYQVTNFEVFDNSTINGRTYRKKGGAGGGGDRGAWFAELRTLDEKRHVLNKKNFS